MAQTTFLAAQHPTDRDASSWWVDLLLLACMFALALGLVNFGLQVTTASEPMAGKPIEIDLSLQALPYYSFLSMSRSVCAYLLSLLFTLVYGAVAAKSRRAEKVLIPVLDILQSIPVLGFLPGLVLTMVALFPKSNIGLELACILMIFTGQAWNMVFSFYGSLRTIPTELREVARLNRLGWWKTFRVLEIPASVIGLIWNSMMSMAGGWFFLTVNEAFRLGDKDFRLPGIGSYMSVAIDKGDTAAMIYACLAMAVMIVATDQLLWRPLAAWATRFKVEDIAGDKHTSWVLDLLRRSRLLRKVDLWYETLRREAKRYRGVKNSASLETQAKRQRRDQSMVKGLGWLSALGFAGFTIWGAVKLGRLLASVDPKGWHEIGTSFVLTLVRVTVAIMVGAFWCIPAGVMIGRSPRLSRLLQPVVQLLASFPAPMLFPLVTAGLIACGIDFSYGCTVLMLLGSQWYILFNVIAGAQSVPGDLVEAARIYGLTGRRLWMTLLIPAVFPSLITGMITAAGGAWNASIVSEYVTYKGQKMIAPGLGSLITRATDAGDFALLCGGVIVMSAALVVINRLVWKKLYFVASQRFALNR